MAKVRRRAASVTCDMGQVLSSPDALADLANGMKRLADPAGAIQASCFIVMSRSGPKLPVDVQRDIGSKNLGQVRCRFYYLPVKL